MMRDIKVANQVRTRGMGMDHLAASLLGILL